MSYLADYIDYKGIREWYPTGTSAEYDAWMSDDNSPATFEEEYYKRIDKNKQEALDIAMTEAERRAQVRADIDANTEARENGPSDDEEEPAPPNTVEEETELSDRTAEDQRSWDLYQQALPSVGNRVFNRNVGVYDFNQYNNIQDYYDALTDNNALNFSNRAYAGSYRDDYKRAIADSLSSGNRNTNIRQQLT